MFKLVDHIFPDNLIINKFNKSYADDNTGAIHLNFDL
jgi:hypothetical protein